jgi:hypothetical protein
MQNLHDINLTIFVTVFLSTKIYNHGYRYRANQQQFSI